MRFFLDRYRRLSRKRYETGPWINNRKSYIRSIHVAFDDLE